MTGYLRFLRREHSDAIRRARQYAWSPDTAAFYRGQAYGLRLAAVGYIARARVVREKEQAA